MEYVTLKDRLNRLDESKQVGTIYRFTSLRSAILMISTNFLKKSNINDIREYNYNAQRTLHYLLNLSDDYDGYCSFTRNKNYPENKQMGIIPLKNTIVRFEIDGDL